MSVFNQEQLRSKIAGHCCPACTFIYYMEKVLPQIMKDQEKAVTTMLEEIKAPTQCEQLVELLKSHFKDKKIRGIELGTLNGATLAYVIENCLNVTMIAIDVEPIVEMFRTKTGGYENRVLLLVGKTDVVIKHWRDLGMGKVDFVWVDADHEYRQVKKDIYNYLPLINEGGIIGGHDYHCNRAWGVTQAVNEIFSKDILHLGKDLTWWVYKNDIKV